MYNSLLKFGLEHLHERAIQLHLDGPVQKKSRANQMSEEDITL